MDKGQDNDNKMKSYKRFSLSVLEIAVNMCVSCVLKNSIQLSSSQIKSFRNVVENNARIFQPLHGCVMMHK